MAFSQTKITGKVISKADKDLFYDVKLFRKDSTLVVGGSFFNSNFEINFPQHEEVIFMKISSLGRIPVSHSIKKKAAIVDVGTIELEEEAKNLDEVRIVKRKKIMEQNNGNLKFNVANSSFSSLGTGKDVLRKIPGIVVTDKGVDVLGRGTPLIMIDGRQSTIDELDRLPSDQIASIELIKTTSAEYSASANTVLKVITLAQKYNGSNFKLTNWVKKATFYSYYTGLDLGYKKNKSAYFGHFDVSPTKKRGTDNFFRNFTDSNYTVQNEIVNDIKTPNNYNFSFNTTQNLSKKSTLYFQTINLISKYETITNNHNLIQQNNNTQNIYTQINSPAKNMSHSDNLVFTHTMDTLGTNFKMLVDYSYFKDQNQQLIAQQSSAGVENFAASFNNESNTFSLNPQFEIPFSQAKMTLKTGLRYSHLNSNSLYYFTNNLDNVIKENIFAGYVQGEKELNKFHFQLGLRYELAKSNAVQNGSTPLFDRKFNNFFPNAAVQYSFSNDLKTNVAYAYKINRPNLNDITSYNQFVDQLTAFSGNPNLLPEFSNVFDLGFTFKDAVSLSFSYINTKNPIFHYFNYQGINTNVMLDNFDFSNKYTVSLNVPYQKGVWSTYNALGYVMQKNVFSEKGIDISNNMLYMSFYNDFDIKKWVKFSVVYQYNSDGLHGLLQIKSQHIFSFSASKKILNNKLEFYVNWNDIFNKNVLNLSANIQQLQFRDRNFNDQQMVQLGIIFKLNNLNNFSETQSNNEEEKRIKKTN